MLIHSQKSYEYVNEFLYFVIRPDTGSGEGGLIYCSGVNVSRFLPLTRGRHGQASNPAMRGLQLVNLRVRDLALSKGATPKTTRGKNCAGIAPTKDTWYTELLLLEHAPESFPDEMIDHCVMDLLRRIVKACMLEVTLPDKLLKPHELQVFIETLCSNYGR